VTIGSLAVNITANTERLTAGFNKARDMMGGFVNKMSAGAAAVTASFGAMLKGFESTGSQLHDMSVATGVSADQLSFLKYAAEQSGGSLELIGKAFKELQAKGVDPKLFTEIATRLASVKDPTLRAGEAIEWFGKRTGTAILPMLENLPALQQKFTELGGTFTDKMATAADTLGDAMGDLKLSLASVSNTIATQLAPVVTQATDYITSHIGIIREWINENPMLVKAIAATALGLTVVAPILYGISTAINVLKTSLAALTVVAALAEKHPVLLALTGAALLGTAAYQHFSAPSAPPTGTGASRSWTPDPTAKATAENTKAQVQLTKEQNDLLRQMAGGQNQVKLAVVGVR
jgi:hypothetical protein